MNDDFDPAAVNALRRRVETLELNQSAAHTASRMNLEKHEERQRVSRWHATRDAALHMAYESTNANSGWGVRAEIVMERAIEIADRAHGPLNADREYTSRVASLVRIAREAESHLRSTSNSGSDTRFIANDLAGVLGYFSGVV